MKNKCEISTIIMLKDITVLKVSTFRIGTKCTKM